MKICPGCKEEIKDDANVCKHCGGEQDTEEVREIHRHNQRQWWINYAKWLIVCFVFLYLVFLTPFISFISDFIFG